MKRRMLRQSSKYAETKQGFAFSLCVHFDHTEYDKHNSTSYKQQGDDSLY